MTDMRLVILGFRDAGKSSAGNTILGGQHFYSKKTVQCVKGERNVDGRHVTIIKAPGWGKDQLLKDTAELMKEEITLSVSLCPPGPHSVLLVIRAGMKFTETSRRAVQEHAELLGERVWSHTIVLFTHGDWLGERSIEQYIESEGKPLQWLAEKCGNRYHVFSNETTKVQVSELFRKVEETVVGNSGHPYEIDGKVLRAVEERKTVETKKAEQMKNKFQETRDVPTGGDAKTSTETVKSIPTRGDAITSPQTVKSKPRRLSKNLRIILLGHSNAGKYSLGNRLLGRPHNALHSVKKQCWVSGRHITVVNTPGWGREQRLSDTPELTRQEIILSVSHCVPGPHVLVLVIRVGETFTELNRRAVQDHMDLLGARVWEHTLVVLKCVRGLDNLPIKQYIEREGKALHWLVEKCGNRCCVLDNKNKSDYSYVEELLKVADSTVEQNGGSHYEMEGEVLQEVQAKKKGQVERAKERENKVRKLWEELKMCEGLEKITIRDKPRKETTTVTNQTKNLHNLANIRLVLLGSVDEGKRAVGNTILGREEFSSKIICECVTKHGSVGQRQVTVINPPGWGREQRLSQTPVNVRQQLLQSVFPPGAHALILVIRADRKFTEANRVALQDHMELLGERVWDHTIVLFTCGDWLGNIAIEQFIYSEGQPLLWVVEKCSYRVHRMNNTDRAAITQVSKLLESIAFVVAKNKVKHFELDSERYQSEKLKIEARERTVKEMRERIQQVMGMGDVQRRSSLRRPPSLNDDRSAPQTEFRIMLLGHRGSGKTAAGNSILGSEAFHTKQSCSLRVAAERELVTSGVGHVAASTPALDC
ncbi:GTPase IMAP family member 8-like [Alosa alosa]|uniref:GTPase IMAP family member 8-like n=1 Tax=Alosa alosa TaxID=278164 RepID=UPI0020154DAA|nr:GTPase IMAP family member 8-like [Alosa alosa]